MNTQQAILIVFMTGLLFVLIAVLFESMKDQMMDPSMIRYLVLGFVFMAWIFLILMSDVYILLSKMRTDLAASQTQTHKKIMKRYVDAIQDA